MRRIALPFVLVCAVSAQVSASKGAPAPYAGQLSMPACYDINRGKFRVVKPWSPADCDPLTVSSLYPPNPNGVAGEACLDGGAFDCSRNEEFLELNTTGPQGLQGEPGPMGPPGPQGPAGAGGLMIVDGDGQVIGPLVAWAQNTYFSGIAITFFRGYLTNIRMSYAGGGNALSMLTGYQYECRGCTVFVPNVWYYSSDCTGEPHVFGPDLGDITNVPAHPSFLTQVTMLVPGTGANPSGVIPGSEETGWAGSHSEAVWVNGTDGSGNFSFGSGYFESSGCQVDDPPTLRFGYHVQQLVLDPKPPLHLEFRR